MAAVNCCQFCAVDVEHGVLRETGLGGGPSQADPLPSFSNDHRTVARHQNIRLDPAAAFHGDDFMLLACLLYLAVKKISSRGVHLLDVQILNVKPQIGNAPGDAPIVAHHHAGHARKADTRDIQPGGVQVSHVPDSR